MSMQPTVFVVDDEPAVRDHIRQLAESADLPVRTYETAMAFLDDYDAAWPGCLVLDLHLPGMSGEELMQRLLDDAVMLPVIVFTGYGEVSLAVKAIKQGAVDFLEKPFDGQTLLNRIKYAMDLDQARRQTRQQQAAISRRLSTLTKREREIMGLVIQGTPNKTIAADLNVSHKTVETHRANVMRKMNADSLAALVRMALTCPDTEGNGAAIPRETPIH